MIYRKKILLAITELFGGKLTATDFQKLLFLFTDQQSTGSYDFIPYKYGCFSFQAMADKNSLIKDGYLNNNKNWETTSENANFIQSLKEEDRKALQKVKARFNNYSTNDLIRHIYINYPYFAINSEIAKNILSCDELAIIERFKPTKEAPKLFTIGYEGRSLEKYLNLLIQQNIKVLCDVRKNPLSRKYGFAKRTLQNACESVNIKYLHLPELGIVSEKRKNLKTQTDYDVLFTEYENTVIACENKAINFIYNLITNYGRVALTCFEASPKQCHRSKVANAVHKLEAAIPIKHL